MIVRLSLMVFLCFLFLGNSEAALIVSGEDFLKKVDQDHAAGVLNFEEALLIKFHHLFDKSLVPSPYKTEGFAPLKCATTLIREFGTIRHRLSPETAELIDIYLLVEESRLSYISDGGHFQLTYSVTGVNAVPVLDVNPANGIPDFVEKVAGYFEQSWESQVEISGFQAPPIGAGTYDISFVQQESYGYTTSVNSATGLTRIVMHPNFEGFPQNDDPEGDVWGAAKVTAAHEFKHATQYVTSRWSEGGWIEVDAVWAEELVFNEVNDYYNYLPGESPIRYPEIPLDGGPTDTGSYEDCVWQLWMSETWGVEIITDFWQWRASHSGQVVMDSWEYILGVYGVTLAEGWAHFTAWNYGTDYRAVTGVGYAEANRYPNGNSVSSASVYPHSHSGSVAHLAANCIRLLDLDGSMNGTLDIQFNGVGTSGGMSVGIHIARFDGTGTIETMTLDGNNDGFYSCQVPLQEIQWAGVIVGNAAKIGLDQAYDITIYQTEGLPLPGIDLDAESLAVSLASDQTTEDYLEIWNSGEAGSLLDFQVQVWGNSPWGALDSKSISGSTLTSNLVTYLPGTTFEMEFTVYNGSSDEEWLTDVTLDFPSGVTINSSTDFVGGSYGHLVSNHQSGNGALVSWHGTVGAEAYGVIKENESALAVVALNVDSSFSGNLTINGTISGDNYGASPHTVSQTVVLVRGNSELVMTYPDGGEGIFIGSSETITWDTVGGVGSVDVALSRDGGNQWQFLEENLVNTGSYETVFSGPGSTEALIRISDSNGSAEGISHGEFNLIELVDWLNVSPVSGSLEPGDFETLTLSFDSTGRNPGLQTAWLVVNHNAAGNARVIPVQMEVTDPLSFAAMPEAFVLKGNYPNPFNPMTRISFNLPAEARTVVDVLDLRGRVVCNLYVGTLEKGEHNLTWDGRNDHGQMVAAGLYLARLRTAGYEATAKMTLAK